MNREAFKQRMQNLKSYREQNPGKGYWDFKSYEDGGEVPPTNKPTIIEPIPYKGKLYSDRYGRKYTEEQVQDYYNNGTDEIDRFTGGPLVRGLKPLLDLEDAANFTPVGDAVAAYDVYDAVSNRDWSGAGLAALGLVPFMPMTVKQFRSKYKGITPKTKSKGGYGHNFNTSVNKNITNNQLDNIINTSAEDLAKRTKAVNQSYNAAERLMDDPEYITRANQVKRQFGDDYIVDIVNDQYIQTENSTQFDSNKHSDIFPDITVHQKQALDNIKKISKDKLINIINTLIIEGYELVEKDERSDRHGNDNATVSDTELQGRRDTHKEKEQGEIQCPEEENR